MISISFIVRIRYPMLIRSVLLSYNRIDAKSWNSVSTFISLSCLMYRSGIQNFGSLSQVSSTWLAFPKIQIRGSSQYTCKNTSNAISWKQKYYSRTREMGHNIFYIFQTYHTSVFTIFNFKLLFITIFIEILKMYYKDHITKYTYRFTPNISVPNFTK